MKPNKLALSFFGILIHFSTPVYNQIRFLNATDALITFSTIETNDKDMLVYSHFGKIFPEQNGSINVSANTHKIFLNFNHKTSDACNIILINETFLHKFIESSAQIKIDEIVDLTDYSDDYYEFSFLPKSTPLAHGDNQSSDSSIERNFDELDLKIAHSINEPIQIPQETANLAIFYNQNNFPLIIQQIEPETNKLLDEFPINAFECVYFINQQQDIKVFACKQDATNNKKYSYKTRTNSFWLLQKEMTLNAHGFEITVNTLTKDQKYCNITIITEKSTD